VSDKEPLPAGKISGVFIDDVQITSQLAMSVENSGNEPLPIPTQHRLAQNYPNPFNHFTKIDYEIAGASFQKIDLTIYNLSGQKVKTFFNRVNAPGYFTVLWDGTSDAGNLVASGIYLYQLKVASMSMVKKLVLIR
jgi:hypothetical protein